MRIVILIESLLVRAEWFSAQMPFSGVEGGIASFLQRFRDGDFLKGQVMLVRRRLEFLPLAAASGDPVGDVDPDRMLSGHDGGPGG